MTRHKARKRFEFCVTYLQLYVLRQICASLRSMAQLLSYECVHCTVGVESTAYLKFTKLQHVFLWLSLQSHYRVTDEAFLAETSKYGPSTFLRMCSLLLKERTFVFLFAFTAVGVVQCGGRKTSPRTSTIVQFIFHCWSFEISEHILRNQNLIIGLDSYSRQRFIYVDPFWYISVFESTAYFIALKGTHVCIFIFR